MQITIRQSALAVCAALIGTGASAEVTLVSNTAAAGGPIGMTATSLVEYASERGIANIQLKDGQTATNYIPALAEGKIDIAGGPFILPFMLSKGVGPFQNYGPEKGAELADNIQLLYPFTLAIFTMYAYDAKGISGWDDLTGLKVLNGPPRGAATQNSRALVQLFGGLNSDADYESVTVSWNQMASAIIDGTADAAVIPSTFPGPRVTQASAAGAMTLYSIPKEAFESEAGQRLLNKPGSVAFSAPASQIKDALGDGWTINTKDDTYRAMAAVGGEYVNAKMDEELAYQLTRAHIENLDDFVQRAPFLQSLNYGNLDPKVAGLCGPNPVKFHPGAVRAWEEAGIAIADCAKP